MEPICTCCSKPATKRSDGRTTIYGTIVQSADGPQRLCDACFDAKVSIPQHVVDALSKARTTHGRY